MTSGPKRRSLVASSSMAPTPFLENGSLTLNILMISLQDWVLSTYRTATVHEKWFYLNSCSIFFKGKKAEFVFLYS